MELAPSQPSRLECRRADRLLVRASAAGLAWSVVLVAATAVGAVMVLVRPAALAEAVDSVTSHRGNHHAAVLWFAVVSATVLVTAVVAQFTEACGAARITSWLRLPGGRPRPVARHGR